MPLPVVHGLLGASVVIASSRSFSWRRNWWPALVGAVLAISPDFDLFFTWVLGYGLQLHGGPSHSLIFAVPLGLFGAWLARQFHRRGILIYITVALSHGLLDYATKKDYGGAQLLWPLSRYKYRLGLFSYYEFTSTPGVEPMRQVLGELLSVAFYETLVCLPLFAALLLWKWRRQAQ